MVNNFKNDPSVLLQVVQIYYPEASYCQEYGEPGYSSLLGIFLVDFNYIPDHVINALERWGYDVEWDDNWIEGNKKLYRTTPDSKHWNPYFAIKDGVVLGGDEIESDNAVAEEYLDDFLREGVHQCDFSIDLHRHNFNKVATVPVYLVHNYITNHPHNEGLTVYVQSDEGYDFYHREP